MFRSSVTVFEILWVLLNEIDEKCFLFWRLFSENTIKIEEHKSKWHQVSVEKRSTNECKEICLTFVCLHT